MIETIVATLVALLAQIAPMLGTASQIAKVVELLTQILPIAVKVGEDLVQPIKNIIAALQANATAADFTVQLTALQALDQAYDAAFEAAATAAQDEDK